MVAEHAQPPPLPPCKLHAFVREEMVEGDGGSDGGGNGAEAAAVADAPLTPAAVATAAASGAPAAVASKKAARVTVSVVAAASAAALAYGDIRSGFVAVVDEEAALGMAETCVFEFFFFR